MLRLPRPVVAPSLQVSQLKAMEAKVQAHLKALNAPYVPEV